MRIRYINRTPTWGNLAGPCRVPRDALAVRFWLYKHSADPGAAMHIWLFEPDGDAWLQRVPFGASTLARAQFGWHEVRMPISAFRFQPRGPGTRQMTTASRMLIDCNYADLEVSIDDMTWEVGLASKRLPLPKTDDLRIVRGKLGSIGILDMGDGLPGQSATAHQPQRLAEAIRAGGFGATIVKPGDMADPKVLTRENFDAVRRQHHLLDDHLLDRFVRVVRAHQRNKGLGSSLGLEARDEALRREPPFRLALIVDHPVHRH